MKDAREKLRELAPVQGDLARLGWLFFLSGEGEERSSADDLFDVLLFDALQQDFRQDIFLPPPSPMECNGEYVLGTVLYPPRIPYASFGLREREWIHHVLIVGMTGTGKTNLLFGVLQEFQRHRKPFLIFDWKRNYRDLLQLPAFQNMRVFTIGRTIAPLHFNPMIPPPGMHAGEWLMKLVDVLKHAYFVGEGVEYLLRQAFDWVYEKTGYYTDSPTGIPTFFLARHYVTRQRLAGRMSLWQASAIRVLESLCFRHGLGPVVNSDTWDYQALLAQPVVFELDGLADDDKIFFTEAMILWLYEYRKTEPGRETFKHALVIEEAHHVLSEKKETSAGAETIMETCLRQIREFGEAVIILDQEPSKLSNSIKANTHTKISFGLSTHKDARESHQEEEAQFPRLQVGEALVTVHGRIPAPVLVGFPQVWCDKGVINDALLHLEFSLNPR